TTCEGLETEPKHQPENQRQQTRARVGEQERKDKQRDTVPALLRVELHDRGERHQERERGRLAQEEAVRLVEIPDGDLRVVGAQIANGLGQIVAEVEQPGCVDDELSEELRDTRERAQEGDVSERAYGPAPLGRIAETRAHRDDEGQIEGDQEEERR